MRNVEPADKAATLTDKSKSFLFSVKAIDLDTCLDLSVYIPFVYKTGQANAVLSSGAQGLTGNL